MKTTDLLTPLSAEWVEKLDRAALQAESLYSVWEREYKYAMAYDEFHFRRDLTLAVQRHELDEQRARYLIEKYKKI